MMQLGNLPLESNFVVIRQNQTNMLIKTSRRFITTYF